MLRAPERERGCQCHMAAGLPEPVLAGVVLVGQQLLELLTLALVPVVVLAALVRWLIAERRQ